MSKEMEEIIKEFKAVAEMYPSPVALHNAIYRLELIVKPVQYVVELKHKVLDEEYFEASINKIFFRSGHHTKIKGICYSVINEMRALLGLPPITIEQIKFVEV